MSPPATLPEKRGTTPYQRKALSAASLGLGLQSMSTMLLSFVMLQMIAEFGISRAAGGMISTVTNLGMLAGGLVFGVIADRYGRAKTLAITVAIFSVATFVTGLVDNIALVYVFRFLTGVGGGGEYGVVMSLVADAFDRRRRGRITSIVTISGQLGAIVAAVAAAVLVPVFGWRGLFIFGGIPILLALWAWFRLPESTAWRQARTAATNAARSGQQVEKVGVLDLFREGRAFTTLKLTLMATVQVAGYFGLMNWLPSILQDQAGVEVSGSSTWMIATIAGMVLGMILFGQFMDRFGPRFAYGTFLVASALAVFAYSYANSPLALLIGGAIVGFFANGMNAGYGAIVGNMYPTRIRATANNIVFNVGRAVGGFSAVVIGFLLDNYSLLIAMSFLSALYLISFLTVLTLRPAAHPEEDAA